MQGIELDLNESSGVLSAKVNVTELNGKITSKALIQEILREQPEFELAAQDVLDNLCEHANNASGEEGAAPLHADVAYRRDAQVSIVISDDEMTAKIQFKAPYGGNIPTLDGIKKIALKHKVTKGIDDQAIEDLLTRAKALPKGAELDVDFASGLPPVNGKPSKATPLFENIQERILRPKEKGAGKVDMRDLGDILAVKPGTPVLEFIPPTDGTPGHTVVGTVIPATPGEWESKQIGAGTTISEDNDCLVIATEEGVPKFENGIVSVEDVFVSPGCNVATGNIKYKGDVLINGDVTEQMMVEASGDVTINGFVESAVIRAGGNIVISQGATGRMEEDLSHSTCQLIADRDVTLQQGRGLFIKCSGELTVVKELAFSSVIARGGINAGDGDIPTGTIYASKLVTMHKVKAGKLGAVSGSKLTIDFTASLSIIENKIANLTDLEAKLDASVTQLEEKISLFANKQLNEQQSNALAEIKKYYASQQKTANRIKHELKRNQDVLEIFDKQIGVETYSKLFPGVKVTLNNKNWETKEELSRARITFENRKWHYEPLV